MKNLLLAFLFFITCNFTFGQTLSTNIIADDCNGVTHDIFAELNSGKVLVIAFVMPCGSCVASSVTAYNVAQSYESTNPGQVLFYVSDDNGDNSCPVVTNWANSNIATGLTTFASTDLTESSFATFGMPKIVVMGGGSHTIFYNEDNSASNNSSAIETAVSHALNATGIKQNSPGNLGLSLAAGRAANTAMLSFNLVKPANVDVKIYNALGLLIKTVANERNINGTHEMNIDLNNLSDGLYFVKFNSTLGSQTFKFIVSH